MKVLEVTGNYPIPPEGGLEVAVLCLARELSRLGIEVRVVGASALSQESQSDGLRVVGLPATRLTNWIRIAHPRSLAALREEIGWADIVHVHNPQELFNLTAAGLTLLARKPLCLTLLSPGTLHRHPVAVFRLLGRMDDGLVRLLIRRAALVHVKNRIDLELVHGSNSNIRLIPDGVPDELLNSPPAGEVFKRRFDLATLHPILLFAGRLHPLKGPDHLIRVLPALSARFPGVAAVLAGPDPMKMTPALLRLARELGVEDRVRIVGSLDERDKIAAIDACSVVVVPSLADFVEGFSIIASEAWARGKPVVGYPSGALKVRIVDGQNGALARSVSPSELAEAVARALALGPIPAVPDVVSWSGVAHQVLNAYAELASRFSSVPVPNPEYSAPTSGRDS